MQTAVWVAAWIASSAAEYIAGSTAESFLLLHKHLADFVIIIPCADSVQPGGQLSQVHH